LAGNRLRAVTSGGRIPSAPVDLATTLNKINKIKIIYLPSSTDNCYHTHGLKLQ
jgi:hypothetical protein